MVVIDYLLERKKFVLLDSLKVKVIVQTLIKKSKKIKTIFI